MRLILIYILLLLYATSPPLVNAQEDFIGVVRFHQGTMALAVGQEMAVLANVTLRVHPDSTYQLGTYDFDTAKMGNNYLHFYSFKTSGTAILTDYRGDVKLYVNVKDPKAVEYARKIEDENENLKIQLANLSMLRDSTEQELESFKKGYDILRAENLRKDEFIKSNQTIKEPIKVWPSQDELDAVIGDRVDAAVAKSLGQRHGAVREFLTLAGIYLGGVFTILGIFFLREKFESGAFVVPKRG